LTEREPTAWIRCVKQWRPGLLLTQLSILWPSVKSFWQPLCHRQRKYWWIYWTRFAAPL